MKGVDSKPCDLIPACLQNTEWTQKLAKALSWLRRDSPYYNLISDESQVWQGASKFDRGALVPRECLMETAAAPAAPHPCPPTS